jgi:hypothetical protein
MAQKLMAARVAHGWAGHESRRRLNGSRSRWLKRIQPGLSSHPGSIGKPGISP